MTVEIGPLITALAGLLGIVGLVFGARRAVAKSTIDAQRDALGAQATRIEQLIESDKRREERERETRQTLGRITRENQDLRELLSGRLALEALVEIMHKHGDETASRYEAVSASQVQIAEAMERSAALMADHDREADSRHRDLLEKLNEIGDRIAARVEDKQ